MKAKELKNNVTTNENIDDSLAAVAVWAAIRDYLRFGIDKNDADCDLYDPYGG